MAPSGKIVKKSSLKTVQERIKWLISNGPTLLMMLDHVSWAMEAIDSLPPLPPIVAMQQLYEGINSSQGRSVQPSSRADRPATRVRVRSSSSSSSNSSSSSSSSASSKTMKSTGTSASCTSCKMTPTKSIKDVGPIPKISLPTSSEASRKRKLNDESENQSRKKMISDEKPSQKLRTPQSTPSKKEIKKDERLPLKEIQMESKREWLREVNRQLQKGKESTFLQPVHQAKGESSSATDRPQAKEELGRPRIIEDITILN